MPDAAVRKQAHELIDRMATGQVSAVVGLLEAMLDPVSISLASAPFDDEPVSEEETRDIAESRAAFARREFTSHEEVLAEFGLSAEDFKRVGRTRLEADPRQR